MRIYKIAQRIDMDINKIRQAADALQSMMEAIESLQQATQAIEDADLGIDVNSLILGALSAGNIDQITMLSNQLQSLMANPGQMKANLFEGMQ